MSNNAKPFTEALSVQQIRTFCCVYESRGYAEAERRLGLASPTMWEQIKAIERLYQSPLFERQGRGIRPTAAGTMLFEMLQPILTNIESTFDVVAELANGPPRQITIVTGVRMMLEELGGMFKQFQSQYPEIALRLMTADNRSAQELVAAGKADLALLIEPPPEMLAAGISCRRLYPIDYLAVLPPRHRLAKRTCLSLADLVEEPLILGNANTIGRQMLDHARFRLGLTQPLRVVVETDNSAVTIACVHSGLGIGIIAGLPSGNLTRHVKAISLADEIGQVYVVAAHRTGRQLTAAIRSLLLTLRRPS